ncbi:DUF3037 domain-containing protein [Planctellipticum variicoloris]|uniref:DUF3037 domain-containing protein n=1 Tax=Planctellipticum variicoloris TaxID=3064265 RepID=UPI0030135A64|nr:DUF3037 domain-containing protein [Planctomycetaceae bacterium SH412]
MNPQKGYYSVVQYCPDLSRVEAANIGVILFCPASGFLKAITSANNGRIIKFFGSEGHDWKRINTVKKALQDRLEKEHHGIRTLDDLQQFIATRANQLQITPPRPMKVLDPEKDLADLFEQVLGQPAKRETRRNFRKLVGEKFSAAGLERKIVTDVKVSVPVIDKEVEIPYGFQNGRFNLINPVRFGGANPEQSLQTACKYAVEGRSLYEHPDQEFGELQLVVVGQFRPTDDKSRALVRRVFEESHVKLFSSDELPKLIAEIKRTGKDIDGKKKR